MLNNKLWNAILTTLGLSTIVGAGISVVVVSILVWLIKCAVIVFCGILFLKFIGLLKLVIK